MIEETQHRHNFLAGDFLLLKSNIAMHATTNAINKIIEKNTKELSYQLIKMLSI